MPVRRAGRKARSSLLSICPGAERRRATAIQHSTVEKWPRRPRLGGPIDDTQCFTDMVAFNGGVPLRRLA